MPRNSMQDQLLKAGVANRKQAASARRAKDTREKMQRKGRRTDDGEVGQAARAVQAAEAVKRDRDRELNRQRQADRDARAIQAQIDQLIELNRVEAKGEIDYAFTDAGVIRSLALDQTARAAVIAGQLGIARLAEHHVLVPARVAMKIAERDPARLVVMNSLAPSNESELPDDYSGYEVPDDLMW